MPPLQLPSTGNFEFFLMGIWLTVPFLLAYWVFKDGESRGEDQAPWWALAVGGLGYMTFFGGFLALAVYVWQRGELAPDPV